MLSVTLVINKVTRDKILFLSPSANHMHYAHVSSEPKHVQRKHFFNFSENFMKIVWWYILHLNGEYMITTLPSLMYRLQTLHKCCEHDNKAFTFFYVNCLHRLHYLQIDGCMVCSAFWKPRFWNLRLRCFNTRVTLHF